MALALLKWFMFLGCVAALIHSYVAPRLYGWPALPKRKPGEKPEYYLRGDPSPGGGRFGGGFGGGRGFGGGGGGFGGGGASGGW